ncbi:hypothetical protein NPIL_20211 [Nephila pilipes]|uniref:Uncharacterized protein n=1 Tax=Nephila pilipes TaxID=299642 RepID=A0A8X6TLR5_NEPPI|nr:hypothetical protein NPIL_20211 [Nephila pilipes]
MTIKGHLSLTCKLRTFVHFVFWSKADLFAQRTKQESPKAYATRTPKSSSSGFSQGHRPNDYCCLEFLQRQHMKLQASTEASPTKPRKDSHMYLKKVNP